MYVVTNRPATYTDQAGITRLYDPDNIGSGGLAGCGCAHQGVLAEVSPTGIVGQIAVGAVAVVGGIVLYRWLKQGRR